MSKLLCADRFRTYSITQLCREFGCTARALRFYEDQGLLAPRRRQMQRVYSYKDRARLRLVVQGRGVGLSLAEIRHLLETYDDQGEAAQNTLALQLFRHRLEVLRAESRQIDTAIDTLSQAIAHLSTERVTAAA
ncbi:MAG: MerR family transcriptional regulator [Phenylobacterium sp.]